MNPTTLKRTSLCLMAAAGMLTAHADIMLWDPGSTGGSGGNGTWDLNSTANWWDSTTSAASTWKDNSAFGTNTAGFVGSAGTVTLNTSLSASNLVFTTTGYTLSGSGTLTMGGNGGIDASALSSGVTIIGNTLSLAPGQHQLLTGAGSVLGITTPMIRGVGATVDYSATGVTNSTLANVNGILGGWATVGGANSAGGDWAANDGTGNMVAYSAYTDVSGQTTTGAGASAQNWKNATATTTLSASAAINSLNQLQDFTLNSGVTLTLNSGGLMLANVSRWMLAGSTTATFLTSGTGSGELFADVPDAGSGADNWTIWPIIADNGPTPVILVKSGAGLLKLRNINNYSGGTIVNSGSLAFRGSDSYGQGITTAGYVTPFGTGPITVNGGARLLFGCDVNSGSSVNNNNTEFDLTNTFTLNGGATMYAIDGKQHIKGNVVVAGDTTLGATYNGGGADGEKGFALDGTVSGTANLTLQQSGWNTGNTWNSSIVYFTGPNPYSGTITVVPMSGTAGGSYVGILASLALSNATINLSGDNTSTVQRFGQSPILFHTGIGSATIGALSGSARVVLTGMNETNQTYQSDAIALSVGNNNASTTYSGVMSGLGTLTKIGNGTLTLSGANTFTANTLVSKGTLALSGGGSLASTNITVGSGATFDVSGNGSLTLSGSQVLAGSGTINGSISTSSGSQVYAGTDGAYGTNTFNNDLNLSSGGTVYLDVGTSTTGPNDRITVGGTLTANNTIIHIKAPSTSSTLQAADYTLITSANPISGSFASAPVWDVQPVNFGNFTVVTSGNTVTLHYQASTAPTAGGTATPNPALRNQVVTITVTATNGTGGTVNNVTVDTSAIGGSSTLALVAAGGNVWTNSVTVTPDTLVGAKTLTATVSDTISLQAIISIPLSVVAGNDVWNGLAADDNFSSNPNWTNDMAPGYVGDSLEFAGTTRLTPNMDNNYTVTAIGFDSTAGSFNIGGASTLTLTNGAAVTNGSANAQTINVPLTLAASATFNAAAGDLTLSGAIANGASAAGLTKIGNHALTLSGSSTFTGPIIANGGTLTISGTVTPSYITGGSVAGKSVLNITSSANITAANIFDGNTTNAVSAVYQTGGSVTLSGGSGDMLAVGNWTGSYGYYNAAGGTISVNGITIGGESNPNVWPPQGTGDGIMEVNGATINNSGWITLARGGGLNTGILNVYSGSLTYAGGGIGCNWNGNASPSLGAQTSIINIMGGSVTSTGQGVDFRTAGDTGILNLNGGLLEGTGLTGSGTLNFNGGTLQAATGNLNFIALTRANVYSGGGTIDNNGLGITVGQPLLAPTGNGVYGISSFTGGAGYIAPPIVIITNGVGDTTGTGATAIAQIDATAGTVTNIVITCPGRDYTATPVFVVSGGGATTAATITGAAPQPNTSGGLTFIGSGTTGVSNVNTYLGDTVISNGIMGLTGSGSLASTNVITYSGAVFDVSTITYTLGTDHALSGYGNVNGSVTAASGSKILGGLDGTYGTNTFNNDLTLASGAACYLDLGTVYNGTNDEIVVTGTLNANGNSIHIKGPSTLDNLDTTADYVLITNGAISGTFASAPIWDVAPANAGHYSILVSGNTVLLHYNAAAAAPIVSATASPATVLRNQSTVITANVIPGDAAVTSVTVDLTAIGGSTVSLVQSNASNVYTNTVTIPPTSVTGNMNLTVTATDANSLSGSAAAAITVSASSEVWNGGGADQKWSTNPNWASGYAPGYASDAIVFGGLAGLNPNMDTNYSVTGLTFDSTAAAFTITSVNNNTLTLGGGLTNNSTAAQTVGVRVTLNGAQTINAAAGGLTLSSNLNNNGNTLTVAGANNTTISGLISGGTALSKVGNGALTLTGTGNVFSGNLSVTGGTVTNTGSTTFGNVLSYIGYRDQSGSMVVNGGAFTNAGEVWVGCSDLSGTAYNAVGALTVSGGANVSLGKLTIGRGNNNQNSIAGTVTVNSGNLTTENDLFMGFAGDSHLSLVVLNGGTLNVASTTKRWVILSQWDTRQSEIDVNGGELRLNAGTDIRYAISGNTGTNVVNLNGGAITLYSTNGVPDAYSGVVDLHQGNGSTVNNTFNLNGGTLTTLAVVSANNAGTRTFNFNGGTLKASAANAGFFNLGTGSAVANVRNGGAIINDSGFAVTIGQPLLHSSIAGDNATDGGLTKLGAGTVALGGANTYNGNTIVAAGTLELTLASLATNSTVSISNAAVLKLDFATTNQIGSLVLNGVTQQPGVYNSTTAAPYITGTGSLIVPSPIAQNPTNITFSVSGNALSLSWPGDHLGWVLQTNAVSLTDTNSWYPYPGSSSVTNESITISPTTPNVFFRLVKP